MGNNNIIPFQDFQEAAKILMERNMPDVLYNKQTGAIFMPETHLPIAPRIVDMQKYEKRKKEVDAKIIQKFLRSLI